MCLCDCTRTHTGAMSTRVSEDWEVVFLSLFLRFQIVCADGQVLPGGGAPMPRPNSPPQCFPPTSHPKAADLASAGVVPAFWTWGRAVKPASQVLPAQKAPLPRSSSETQASLPAPSPITPPFTLSSSEALVLNPSLFQMWQHLTKAEAKLHTLDSGGRGKLSESVYTDVLDQSCSQTWQG